MSAWSYEGGPALPTHRGRGPDPDYHQGWHRQLEEESRRRDSADQTSGCDEAAQPTAGA